MGLGYGLKVNPTGSCTDAYDSFKKAQCCLTEIANIDVNKVDPANKTLGKMPRRFLKV